MKINEVIPLSNHNLRIISDEDVVDIFNIQPYLKYEVFQPLKEISELMKISNGGYFVEWGCETDLSANTIKAKLI